VILPPRWRAFVLTATLAALGLALARRLGIEGHEAGAIDLAARSLGAHVAAYPPLAVLLTALLDSLTAGLLPSPADLLSVLIAGAVGALAGGRALPMLWAPGSALALAQGPGVMLLCLLMLGLGLALRRFRAGDDPLPLIGAGMAAGLMPFAHAGGAALALICAPLGIAALSPALIAGRGFGGTLLLGLFPLGALAAAYGALAAIYGGDPAQPFARLLGTPGDGGIAPALGLIWIVLAPAVGPLLWRAATMPDPDRLIAAGLLIAPVLAGLLYGLGGGAATAGQVAGPAAVVACLAPDRRPAALALSWGLLLLAASSPWAAPC